MGMVRYFVNKNNFSLFTPERYPTGRIPSVRKFRELASEMGLNPEDFLVFQSKTKALKYIEKQKELLEEEEELFEEEEEEESLEELLRRSELLKKKLELLEKKKELLKKREQLKHEVLDLSEELNRIFALVRSKRERIKKLKAGKYRVAYVELRKRNAVVYAYSLELDPDRLLELVEENAPSFIPPDYSVSEWRLADVRNSPNLRSYNLLYHPEGYVFIALPKHGQKVIHIYRIEGTMISKEGKQYE